MPFNRATMTTWRPRVRFAAHFGGTRAKFSGTQLSPVPGDDVASSRRERKGNGGGREQKKENPSKFRAICSMALPDYHPGTRGTSATFLVRLTPLGCSRGEIQIYAPTVPGVFFELMKNESGRRFRLLFFRHSLRSATPDARSFSELIPSAAMLWHGSLLPVVSKS